MVGFNRGVDASRIADASSLIPTGLPILSPPRERMGQPAVGEAPPVGDATAPLPQAQAEHTLLTRYWMMSSRKLATAIGLHVAPFARDSEMPTRYWLRS